MSTGVISHEQVLTSIYEFLSHFGYRESLIALQAESGVAYNTIRVAAATDTDGSTTATVQQRPDAKAKSRAGGAYPPATREGLEAAVLDGQWAEVLHVYVDGLLLPEDVRAALYEAVFEELLEVHGLLPAARALLYNAPALAAVRRGAPARFARLERTLTDFDLSAWEEESRRRAGVVPADVQRRRETVLRTLLSAIHFTSEPYDGRLPAALYVAAHGPGAGESGARKRSREDGQGLEVASAVRGGSVGAVAAGTVASRASATTAAAAFLGYPLAAPRTVSARYECGESSRSVAYVLAMPEHSVSSAGVSHEAGRPAIVLIGRADGTVDFTEARSGTPAGPSVNHTQGVLSMCLDEPVEGEAGAEVTVPAAPAACWVAVGYRDGWVKVYNTATHKLVRRFPSAHSLGVTCIAFAGYPHPAELSGHSPLLLSGSYDTTIKLLSLASGTVLYTLQDAHRGAFVNALCPLPSLPGEDGDASLTGTEVVLSAGNDGTLAVWRVNPHADELAADPHSARRAAPPLVTRVGPNLNVRALHADCREAIVTGLTLLAPRVAGANAVAAEVILLTRAAVALVLSIRVDMNAELGASPPVRPTLLCLLRAHKPLRHLARVPAQSSGARGSPEGGAPVHLSTTGLSAAAPMLSLYVTDSEGTLGLYNVEMIWRDAERWASFGGAVTVVEPTDASPAVITEVGRTIPDLHVCPLALRAGEAPAVVVSSESLPAVYVLQ